MGKTAAEKMYRSIFKKEIPPVVGERFAGISQKMERGLDAGEVERHRKITEKISDLAAAEYTSRILGKNRLLVKQFQVMVYLGECLPENYSFFINEKSARFKTLLIFAWVPFNSMYKFFKGLIALGVKGR